MKAYYVVISKKNYIFATVKKERNIENMKKIIITLLAFFVLTNAHAVLKEKNLEQTLNILRTELTEKHQELNSLAEERKVETQEIINQLKETIKQSNQNALMLYSQNPDYVFDLTYACHEATEQYQDFQRQQLPFRTFLEESDIEIAKYDSLINSLKAMRPDMLNQQAKTDRNVCLTLATNIQNTLIYNRMQVADYITFYEMAELRLKNLNDYADKRYNDIQTGIFLNGGENYLVVLSHFKEKSKQVIEIIEDKYSPNGNGSDWDSSVIMQLFLTIAFYVMVAILLNLLVFKRITD